MAHSRRGAVLEISDPEVVQACCSLRGERLVKVLGGQAVALVRAEPPEEFGHGNSLDDPRERSASRPRPLSTPSDQPYESGPRTMILIVEDHDLLADALAQCLGGRGFACAVASLTSSARVLQDVAELRPALVLLDLNLDGIDGLDLIPGLRTTGTRVLVVTGTRDQARRASAIALGASGWVSKAQPFEHLLEAAEAVLWNRPLLGSVAYEELARQGKLWLEADQELKRCMAQLTARERQVLRALSEGESAEVIARELFLSIGTIRSHIQSILGKLGVSSQLAAVAKARPLLNPDDDPPWRR